MLRKIGQKINHITYISVWMFERVVTRLGFIFVASYGNGLLKRIVKQIFSESLKGTEHYISEAEKISWTIILEGIGLFIGLAIIVLITQPLGEFLEYIMEKLQRKQYREIMIDNKKIGKSLFDIWLIFSGIIAFLNLIMLCEYTILYPIILCIIDIFSGWFVFGLTFNLEPIELFCFVEAFSDSSGGIDILIHID